MDRVLTIAIPTYNRYGTLKETLDSIAVQWEEEFLPFVEVIVSDNASADCTKEIVNYESFTKLHAKYYRNEENIGPDRNFFRCWDMAEGKYVLLLSDDDILLMGALKACLHELRKQPDILYLTVGKWIERNKDQSAWPEQVSEFRSDEDFIRKLGLTVCVLSSLVLKKEYIDTKRLEKYVGSFFTQIYAVANIMKECGKYYIIRETPSIGNRPGNQRGYNLYDQWLVYFQDALMYFTEIGLTRKFCRKVFRDSIKEHISVWLYKFSKYSTRLDTRITMRSILATIVYPESWRYLYRGMLTLWLSQRKNKRMGVN